MKSIRTKTMGTALLLVAMASSVQASSGTAVQSDDASLVKNEHSVVRYQVVFKTADGGVKKSYHFLTEVGKSALQTETNSKGYVSWCGKTSEGRGMKTDIVNTGTTIGVETQPSKVRPLAIIKWTVSWVDRFDSKKVDDCIEEKPVITRFEGDGVAAIDVGQSVVIGEFRKDAQVLQVEVKRVE